VQPPYETICSAAYGGVVDFKVEMVGISKFDVLKSPRIFTPFFGVLRENEDEGPY
jgi:hypothetical protein